MSNFLKSILKDSGNEYASLAVDGLESDISGFVDTGSYAFNALLSGTIHGGMPNNKIIGIAGESATGKTYFALGIARQFLQDNVDAAVLYFDSEQAVTSDMINERGLDPKRVAVFPIATVEQFRHQLLQILDSYGKLNKEQQKPMLIVLDSLGMLSTSKEMNDGLEGKEVRDMTRSQVIKSVFRTMTLKLGKLGIPLIVTNHTYDIIGCLSDEVSILMQDGSVKLISQVAVGDKVKTMAGSSTVSELFCYDSTDTIKVELSDGTIFHATQNHKFMTRDGAWKPISELLEGEEILSIQQGSHS
jgi:RecA/RadA recombinase